MQPAPCFKLHHRYLLVSEIPLEDLKNVPYFFGRCIAVSFIGKTRFQTQIQNIQY